MKRRNAVALPGTLLILLSASLLIASAQGTPAVDWWVIAGGGGPSSGGGDISLNDTLGQPVIGSAAGSGDVALVDGYWPGAGAASAAAVRTGDRSAAPPGRANTASAPSPNNKAIARAVERMRFITQFLLGSKNRLPARISTPAL